VFKKVVQIVLAWGVMAAGYAGYLQLYALTNHWVRPMPIYIEPLPNQGRLLTKSAREAVEVAGKAFGPDHWAVKALIRYYSSSRGFWMFADQDERQKEGRRVKLWPFAVVWRSQDGNTLKILEADQAEIDFDQPFDAVKPGGKPLKVIRATISGNVRLRDDKGTPEDPKDDLVIGPMAKPVVYDEPTLLITSESAVELQDKDMWATGVGLRIELRPNEPLPDQLNSASQPGFNGAKAVELLKEAHVVIKNVGRSGILPGTHRASDPGEATPLDVTSAGAMTVPAMRIELPKPKPPAQRGAPPTPPDPTFVDFATNVCVRRGAKAPDQLNSDRLHLTMLPTETPPDGTDPPPSEGTLGNLTLRSARATGHAVWLQSPSQGFKALGNELIYKKLAPAQPDETYFRADAGSKVFIERVELYGPGEEDKGKIKLIDTLWTADVTIYQEGPEDSATTGGPRDDGPSTVIARGPGHLKSRERRDGPVVREAAWRDQLIVRTVLKDQEPWRYVTLIGQPMIADPTSGTLTALAKIEACLRPKPKPEEPPTLSAALASNPSASLDRGGQTFLSAQKPDRNVRPPRGETAPSATGGGDAREKEKPSESGYQVEWMRAVDHAHLVQQPDNDHPDTPRRDITAEEKLEVKFIYPPKPKDTKAEPAEPPAQVAAAQPDVPAPEAQATTQPTPPKKPPAPPLALRADRIFAQILQQPGRQAPGAANRSEIQNAFLQGRVAFHQDANPDEQQEALDATGDAVRVVGQAEGKSWLKITGGAQPERWAQVANGDSFQLQGPIIIFDQESDFALVPRRGRLVMLVEKGLMSEEGPAPAPKPRAQKPPAQTQKPGLSEETRFLTGPVNGSKPNRDRAGKIEEPKTTPRERVPLTITWRDKMEFFGRSLDEHDRPAPGKAHFFGQVYAHTDDALVACEDMEAFLDQPVSFSRAPRDSKAREPNPQPKPQIVFVDCRAPASSRPVIAVNRKRDPETGVFLEMQRVEGPHLTYDKPTDRFHVTGAGVVKLYGRQGRDGLNPAQVAANPNAKSAPKLALQPIELTRIQFHKEMRGRLGTPKGKGAGRAPTRQADFWGDVDVLHGPVGDEYQDLSADNPPRQFVRLVSRYLRVISIPPPSGSNAPAHNMLNALGNAHAETIDRVIQGDQITYDSLKDLFYCYGFDGREVVLAQQTAPGQPASNTTAKALMYNHKTGESWLDAPQTIRLTDSVQTGIRPFDIPYVEPKPEKPNRKDIRLPPISNKERRGYSGQ
jgi:hypothetical protein